MQQYEYKVVPAPQKGEKARGTKTTAERFAAALMTVMNDLGRDGWDYVRADTLPCEERVGLTGRSSSFLHMLVFRRPLAVRSAVPLPAESASPRVTPFAKPVIVPASATIGTPVAGSAFAAPPVIGPGRSTAPLGD